jgi:predicted anti-sigma-YlaC factor YlaD
MLHERLDGQSTPADDARLERHLGGCGGCRSEAEPS